MMDRKNKVPFSNCSVCPLYEQGFCGTEHNLSSKNLSDGIDLLVLGEAPSHEEIKEKRPLIGKAGKVFRSMFNEFNLSRFTYIISNVVLCSNIVDGKTVTPPDKAIECCSGSWKFLIKRYKPKVVLLLGTTACKALGLLNGNTITSIRGNFFRLEEFPNSVFLPTFHPSFVLRNGIDFDSGFGKMFKEDFSLLNNYFSNNNIVVLDSVTGFSYKGSNDYKKLLKKCVEVGESTIINIDGMCYYKLDDKFYSDEYFLISCQRLGSKEVIYIFKRKDGSKLYFIDKNMNVYFYINKNFPVSSCRPIEDVKNVEPVVMNKLEANEYFSSNSKKIGFYEFDVKDTTKRVIDYWLLRGNKPENIELKKMYLDIEVFNEGDRSFPDPKQALKKISSISYKLNDGKIVILLNTGCASISSDILESVKKNFNNSEYELYLFDNESSLIYGFIERLMNILPDVITGWNVIEFDIQYLVNRMRLLNIDSNLLSPFGFVSVFYSNLDKEVNAVLNGFCVLDMMRLHKEYSDVSEESYSLNSISEKYLSEKKVEYEGTLDDLFVKDINRFLEYAVRDVYLLYRLDNYFEYIYLNFELSNISNSLWNNFSNTMKLVDSLCLSYIKKFGKVSRNVVGAGDFSDDNRILGAYVLHPIKGIHENVIDLDFSSMYPSIIRSFNIGPNTYVGKISEDIATKILYTKDYRSDDVIEFEERIYNKSIDSVVEVKRFTIGEFIEFIKNNNYVLSSYGTVFKSHREELSYFSDICRYLMERRTVYNNLVSELRSSNREEEAKKYDLVQLSYKILNNSLYGVLSNKHFRFYDLDLAQTITFVGRVLNRYCGYYVNEYLKGNVVSSIEDIDGSFLEVYKVVDESSSLGMRSSSLLEYIIYQDTDSIFCDLGKYFVNVMDSSNKCSGNK